MQVQKRLLDRGILTNKRKSRINQELRELIREIHLKKIVSAFEAKIDDYTEKILKKEMDPYTAAIAILNSE